MALRYGGEVSQALGLVITCEAPAGTSTTTPVQQGEIFKIAGTAADGTGYKLAALTTNDTPDSVVLVRAEERVESVTQVATRILGRYKEVRRLDYEGSPTIGSSIQAGTAVRKVKGVAFAAGSYILYVDTTATKVEVLI